MPNVLKQQVSGIKEFLSRVTLIEFLVAVSLGSVFASVVSTVVKEVLTPLLNVGLDVSLGEHFWIIKCRGGPKKEYETVDEARANGCAVVGYGRVVQAALVFAAQVLATYLLLKILFGLQIIKQ